MLDEEEEEEALSVDHVGVGEELEEEEHDVLLTSAEQQQQQSFETEEQGQEEEEQEEAAAFGDEEEGDESWRFVGINDGRSGSGGAESEHHAAEYPESVLSLRGELLFDSETNEWLGSTTSMWTDDPLDKLWF